MGALRYWLHTGVVAACVLGGVGVLLAAAVASVFSFGDDALVLRMFGLGGGLWIGGLAFGVLMNG